MCPPSAAVYLDAGWYVWFAIDGGHIKLKFIIQVNCSLLTCVTLLFQSVPQWQYSAINRNLYLGEICKLSNFVIKVQSREEAHKCAVRYSIR